MRPEPLSWVWSVLVLTPNLVRDGVKILNVLRGLPVLRMVIRRAVFFRDDQGSKGEF